MDAGGNVGQDPPSFEARKSALELERLEAEIAKAKADRTKSDLEAAELRRRWFQKPAVLLQLIVILGIIATGIIGHINGWFSTQLESLHNQQDKAEIALEKLNEARSARSLEVAALTSQVADLKAQVAKLKSQAVASASQRDSLSARLRQTLASTQKFERDYANASTSAAQGEVWHKQFGNLSLELQQTLNELAAYKANVGTSGVWREGDIVLISVTAQPIQGGSSDFIVSYPVLSDDSMVLRSGGPRGNAFLPNPPSRFAPDCRQPFGGTCRYTVGALAIALDYVRINVSVDDAFHEPKTLIIQNGTREVNVNLRTYYSGHNL